MRPLAAPGPTQTSLAVLRTWTEKRLWRGRSCVRLAARVYDLFELAEHAHAGKQLGEAGVRLALFLDRGDEFPVLEFDAVHRHVHLGYVDRVLLSVGQVVVERLVGTVVADVAEERAERPVIVE